MKITNAFDIAAPPEVVWPILNDVPRIARCVPGATVEESIEAETYRVTVPLRFGFFTISYATEIVVSKRDDDTYTAEVDIEGRQLVGSGVVRAHVHIHAERRNGGTHVDLETDAELGGFVATVGKPIVDGVARKTVKDFAKKLETIIP
jgi:carbon monoxide dehydrogenase subunit G